MLFGQIGPQPGCFATCCYGVWHGAFVQTVPCKHAERILVKAFVCMTQPLAIVGACLNSRVIKVLACFVQKLMKQGLHNLRSQQYQLLFVDNGIVHGKEQEEWKVLKASETY